MLHQDPTSLSRYHTLYKRLQPKLAFFRALALGGFISFLCSLLYPIDHFRVVSGMDTTNFHFPLSNPRTYVWVLLMTFHCRPTSSFRPSSTAASTTLRAFVFRFAWLLFQTLVGPLCQLTARVRTHLAGVVVGLGLEGLTDCPVESLCFLLQCNLGRQVRRLGGLLTHR